MRKGKQVVEQESGKIISFFISSFMAEVAECIHICLSYTMSFSYILNKTRAFSYSFV